MTHICIGKLIIIDSDNGLAPGQRQAIIWCNAAVLLIRTSGTYFGEILSKIHTFSFKKMHLKLSSAKWRPFCLSLNVLRRSLVTYLFSRQPDFDNKIKTVRHVKVWLKYYMCFLLMMYWVLRNCLLTAWRSKLEIWNGFVDLRKNLVCKLKWII